MISYSTNIPPGTFSTTPDILQLLHYFLTATASHLDVGSAGDSCSKIGSIIFRLLEGGEV